MPFAQISVGAHRSAADVKAISDGVYESLLEAVHAPKGDNFQVISRRAADELIYSKDYLGIHRSENLTFIQIFFYPGRTVAQRKLLFQTIANKLAAKTGMRKEDIFITLIDVPKENWSYGNGEAQFAPMEAAAVAATMATPAPTPAAEAAWLAPTALGFSVLSLTLAVIVLLRNR